ncbi:MAG: hypothetical protein WCJ09_00130 [Planctomycetota bacterium]
MQDNGLDRRDFHKLTVAALGGMIAGTTVGCTGTPPTQSSSTSVANSMASATLTDAEKLIIDEPHTCRGLNSCKNLGRSKDNACAGQGTCASIADASCSGNNECKGQGGCGEDPGMNSCKGKGGCHIPLMESAWTKARTAFEGAMKKSGKTVGAAPAKAKG